MLLPLPLAPTSATVSPGASSRSTRFEHAPLPGGIAERDAFQTHRHQAGARRRGAARAGSFGHVDEPQKPLADGEAVRARMELGGEVAEREVELRGKDEDRQPCFEADAALDEANADGHSDERDPERRRELEHRSGQKRDPEGSHRRPR